MSIETREVKTKKDMKDFLKIPFDIYKDNEYWVPELVSIEQETFDPKKNPGYQGAETKLFIAYKDGKLAGRIVGLNSKIANEKYKSKNMRFGWFESINDKDVSSALFNEVFKWAKGLNMETITGPHGFSDLDKEGMLIEGFNELPTVAVYYNHPYYKDLVENSGFVKDIDYWEFQTMVPHEKGIPPKLLRLAERIKERSSVKVIDFKSKRHLMSRAEEMFRLLDETFEEIYGSVPLNKKQISYYVKKYITFVDKDMIKAIENEEGEMIAFMITLPSLSKAFQISKGKLFPFGWYHILKALKTNKILDFYLAGVRKKYRGTGVDLMMVIEIVKSGMKKGYIYAESNPELETNEKVHAQWKYFEPRLHKKRRIFKKDV